MVVCPGQGVTSQFLSVWLEHFYCRSLTVGRTLFSYLNQILKRDWESERDQCLENLRKELSAQHQSEVDHLRSQFEKELAEQKAELEKTFQAKNQAECEYLRGTGAEWGLSFPV